MVIAGLNFNDPILKSHDTNNKHISLEESMT